jgi:DNA (cytosine-5)-methyltransferase 1
MIDDPRNQLFREYVRLLRYFRPKKLVMENVTGMVKGEMIHTFHEIMRELRSCGYNVKSRVLNAMHYGVPQARQRVIFIGSRVGEPEFPAPWSEPITVRDAWAGLDFATGTMMVDKQYTDAGNKKYGTKDNCMKPRSLDVVGSTPIAEEAQRLASFPDQFMFIAPKPGSKMFDGGPKYKGLKNAKEGEKINYIAERLAFDKVCNTIRTGDGAPCSGWYSHPTEMRGISLAEAKRIGSFPDQFEFGDWRAGCRQIGNCVPPLLMRAVAERLASHGGSGEMTDFKRTVYAKTKPGAKAKGVLGLFTRLAWNIVAPTVMRQFGVYGVAGLYHPDEARPLTVGEYRRIASFPDGFRFGTWLDAVAQMGNCAPPLDVCSC